MEEGQNLVIGETWDDSQCAEMTELERGESNVCRVPSKRCCCLISEGNVLS